MNIVPISRAIALAFVARVHRQLSPPPGDVMRVGLVRDGMLVGVAMAGRPVARMADDGATLEVTRVAVEEGVPNGCSMLYGALARAAKALGYSSIITYTREDEPASRGRRCELRGGTATARFEVASGRGQAGHGDQQSNRAARSGGGKRWGRPSSGRSPRAETTRSARFSNEIGPVTAVTTLLPPAW